MPDLCRSAANSSARREIDVLTPGDFGPMTITHGTINGPITSASIVWPARNRRRGTSGIVINAGPNYAVESTPPGFYGFNASGASIIFRIDNGAGTNGALHVSSAFQRFDRLGHTCCVAAPAAAADTCW